MTSVSYSALRLSVIQADCIPLGVQPDFCVMQVDYVIIPSVIQPYFLSVMQVDYMIIPSVIQPYVCQLLK